MKVFGEYPSSDVLMAACDSVYFHRYGPSFIYSANEAGNAVHIHIVNPDDDDWALARQLDNDTDITLSFSGESTDLGAYQPEAYYACSRFIIAEHILTQIPTARLMILDIDSLILGKVEFPDAPLGIFHRPELPNHMKVAAGIVYATSQSLSFIKRVVRIIYRYHIQWYCDQHALFDALEYEDNFHRFPAEYLDWKFGDDSIIWTGKGNRKHDNEKYTAKQTQFERLSGFEERFWCEP